MHFKFCPQSINSICGLEIPTYRLIQGYGCLIFVFAKEQDSFICSGIQLIIYVSAIQ